MSYCRWSSDDFACDLYAYEAKEGFVVHIAGSRLVGNIPKVEWDRLVWDNPDLEELIEQVGTQNDAVEEAERREIDLPFAGETFVYSDLEEFRDGLESLRGAGYNFPDVVFDMIDDEIEDRDENERLSAPAG